MHLTTGECYWLTPLRRCPDNDSKRPMLIIVDSEITKRNIYIYIFGKIYKLRNNVELKTFVSHDMSAEERKQTKILAKAKENVMKLNNDDSSRSKTGFSELGDLHGTKG